MFNTVGVGGKLVTFAETGTLRIVRVVNGNRLAAVSFHDSKTGHVGRPVADVNHVWKRDRPDIGVHVIVHVLRHVEQAFVNSKQELRFLSVTDDAFWKSDPALFVLGKFAAENGAHVRLQPAAIQ